jgi:hypothetical protein
VKESYIPEDIANNLRNYMISCGYANGTINMKLGNLNFLFSHYGKDKFIKMLNTAPTKVWETIEHIEKTLPKGCIVTSDVHAFKIAWESINGVEIIKKRVKKA